jgi:hypothetical protein
MTFKIHITALQANLVPTQAPNQQDQTQSVVVQLSAGNSTSRINLGDPLGAVHSDNVSKYELIRWYFERYASEEPFETSKGDLAVEALASYGRNLAAQLIQNASVPKIGDLEIAIFGRNDIAGNDDSSVDGNFIQKIFWEVLEDVELWPAGYKLSSVSVFRSTTQEPDSDGRVSAVASGGYDNRTKKRFNILLVVSRPRQAADIDYQLVSRCLVAMVGSMPKTNPDVEVTLKILRPPTWQEFRNCLNRDYEPGHFDLVHFDMHGAISKATKRSGQ